MKIIIISNEHDYHRDCSSFEIHDTYPKAIRRIGNFNFTLRLNSNRSPQELFSWDSRLSTAVSVAHDTISTDTITLTSLTEP
ncbi:hypothetical protein GN958_ATG23329 [Phytophthora infestans]|uniref:Uncharacterized protein n=1 Tax=Phytophthora infestans TaxID=4787 RepID=A0A8S9TLS9_PHYIN|nr:hypothetical protein GN958_ATG23329 [Phytophthora infestans]